MNETHMMVHEVVKLTGITARTLHYYDEIGLLKPSIVTEAKYRLYTDADLCRLQEILFFREVGFALKEIKNLLNSPNYNRSEALEKHLSILEAQRERIDGLIVLVKAEINGAKKVSFSAFPILKYLNCRSSSKRKFWSDGGILIASRSMKQPFLQKPGRFKVNRWRIFSSQQTKFLKDWQCMRIKHRITQLFRI